MAINNEHNSATVILDPEDDKSIDQSSVVRSLNIKLQNSVSSDKTPESANFIGAHLIQANNNSASSYVP